ncbi:hypothetical protein PsYK624_164550 [Phanerochaete sordida]|uniref:Mediator of RNA polymerase II transcription subunit 8 n=1 Tax=Phanerochaete sordida TaxID=48140 RepID=A0A9P3GQY3_9APHY|nr:hypothetical protein PsYK624_164550 [Phanerochaete sordida]
MSQVLPPNVPVAPLPTLQPAPLPVAQLESLRSKINSMIESIQTLQATIDQQGQNVMPSWPDILSKYTILLSQSHNLSMSLVGPAAAAKPVNGHGAAAAPPTNPYERLALHPSVPMTDQQLDNELIPLLRGQQTTDVLKLENDTVRHLAEHMSTRGSLSVLGVAGTSASADRPRFGVPEKKVDYADVLRECEQIRLEHDERVDRAVRAVMLLREKFEWKARVEVETEEPEELDWDPLGGMGGDEHVDEDIEMNLEGGAQTGDEGKDDQSNESEEEEELEEVLGNGADNSSPMGTPQMAAMDEDAPPGPGQSAEAQL